jgi:hypothetical protein
MEDERDFLFEGDERTINPFKWVPEQSTWMFDKRGMGTLLWFIASQANKDTGNFISSTFMDKITMLRAFLPTYEETIGRELFGPNSKRGDRRNFAK